jgi:hypothetical protein
MRDGLVFLAGIAVAFAVALVALWHFAWSMVR